MSDAKKASNRLSNALLILCASFSAPLPQKTQTMNQLLLLLFLHLKLETMSQLVLLSLKLEAMNQLVLLHLEPKVVDYKNSELVSEL